MKRKFLLLLALLIHSIPALAEYYSAKTNFDYPGNKVYAGGFAKVNDSKFITYMHGAEGKGVYAVNRKTGAAELILRNNVHFNFYEIWDSYFHSLDNGALIDVFGKLYVTDGTRTGTRYIGDFGSTDTGGTLAYTFSRISKVVQAGSYVYVQQTRDYNGGGNNQDQVESALWRVDLKTATRTRIHKEEAYAYTSTIMDHSDQGDSVIVFSDQGAQGVGLWRASPEHNQLMPLALFEDGEGRKLGVWSQWTMRTNAGLFFCPAEVLDKDAYYSVWRLSNSNTLTRIAENCGEFGNAAVSSDKKDLFYMLEDGEVQELWQNSGTASSNRRIKRLQQDSEVFTNLCVADDVLVATVLFKDSRGDYKEGVYLFGQDDKEQFIQDSYASCVADKIVLGDALAHPLGIDSVFDPETQQQLKVHGIGPSERMLGYQTFSDEVLWLFQRTVNEAGEEAYRYRERILRLNLKDGQYAGFMPGILDFLNDDESDSKAQ